MKKTIIIVLVVLLALGASISLVACDGFNIDFGTIIANYVNYENLYLRVEYPDAMREFSKYGDTIYVTEIRDNTIVDGQFLVKKEDKYYNIIALQGAYYKMPLLKERYDATAKYMTDTQQMLSKVSKNASDFALTGDTLKGKNSDGHEIVITFGSDHLRYKAPNAQYVFKKAKEVIEPTAKEEIIFPYYLARIKNAGALMVKSGSDRYVFDDMTIERKGVLEGKNVHDFFIKDGARFLQISEKAKAPIVEPDPNAPPTTETPPPPVPTIKYDFERREVTAEIYQEQLDNVAILRQFLADLPTDPSQYVIDGNSYSTVIGGEEYNLTLYGDMLAMQSGDMIMTFSISARIIVPIAEIIME